MLLTYTRTNYFKISTRYIKVTLTSIGISTTCKIATSVIIVTKVVKTPSLLSVRCLTPIVIILISYITIRPIKLNDEIIRKTIRIVIIKPSLCRSIIIELFNGFTVVIIHVPIRAYMLGLKY